MAAASHRTACSFCICVSTHPTNRSQWWGSWYTELRRACSGEEVAGDEEKDSEVVPVVVVVVVGLKGSSKVVVRALLLLVVVVGESSKEIVSKPAAVPMVTGEEPRSEVSKE